MQPHAPPIRSDRQQQPQQQQPPGPQQRRGEQQEGHQRQQPVDRNSTPGLSRFPAGHLPGRTSEWSQDRSDPLPHRHMPEPSIEERLWWDYRARPSLALRNELVSRYLPLAKHIARTASGKLPKGHGYHDDVFSTAYLGLIESVEDFDPKKGRFRPYAKKKIRGAIVDGMRSFERHQRQVWLIARVRIETENAFEREHGRAPSDGELLAVLGWSTRKLERSRRKVLILSEIQARVEDQEKAGPYANTIPDRHDQAAEPARGELFDRITRGLTQQEKSMVRMYYFEGLSMQETGDLLGCSESRVCQALKAALKWLRQARAKSEGELWEVARGR